MRRMTAWAMALVMVTGGLAGCLADEPPPAGSPGNGTERAPPPGPLFHPAVNVSSDTPGAEPVVDVGPDGTIYVQGQGFFEEPGFDASVLPGEQTPYRLWRSTDGGETWTNVSPPGRGRNGSCDGYVAVADDGTVYTANCYIVTYPAPTEMVLHRSDDAGETWTELIDPPFPPDMHRMWLVPEGDQTLHVTVESAYPAGGLFYLVSHDRGQTWEGPFSVDPDTIWGSNLAVDAERDLLYAVRFLRQANPEDTEDLGDPSGPFVLRVSADGGRTWDQRPMFGPDGRFATSAWQPLTLDPNGTLYLVWAEEEDGRAVVHYAFSTDQGASWEDPVALTSIEGTQTLPWAQARGPGELGISFYETPQEGMPSELDARWHGGYALVEGADTPNATVRDARVTDWFVHEGNICIEVPCRGEEDRRLLEYTGVAFGPQGLAHTVFATTRWDGFHGLPVFALERAPNGTVE